MTNKQDIHKAAYILGTSGVGLGSTSTTTPNELSAHAKLLGALGGVKGGPARAKILSKRRRKDIATYASLCAKIKRNTLKLTPQQKHHYAELKEMFSKD